MKKKTRIALALATALLLTMPTLAYAGVSAGASGGDGTSNSGSGNKFYWQNWLSSSCNWQYCFNVEELRTRAAAGEELEYADGGDLGSKTTATESSIYGSGVNYDQNIYGTDCLETTWVVYANGDWGYVGRWHPPGQNGSDGRYTANFRNNLGAGGSDIANWWVEVSNDYMSSSEKFKLYGGGTRSAYFVNSPSEGVRYAYIGASDIQNTVVVTPPESDDPDYLGSGRTVITKASGGGDDYDFDDNPTAAASGDYNQWMYYYGRTSGSYANYTPATGKNGVSQDYSQTLTLNLISVQKVKHSVPHYYSYTTTNSDGSTSSHTGVYYTYYYTYESTGYATYTRTFKYKTSLPSNAQVYFKPINLNRSDGSTGYAQTGDGELPSTYANATDVIDATVDNQSGVSDGSYLETLDLNSDKTFTVKFNNNQFGLTRFNFLKAPRELANGTYETANPYGTYANGLTGEEVPTGTLAGFWHYNTKLSMSISNGNGGSNDVASLIQPDGTETTASNSITYNGVEGATNYTGGSNWSARFSYSGKYTTDSNLSGSPSWVQKWWAVSYDQKRFYEYGIWYQGSYSTSGINSANTFKGTTASKTSSGSAKKGTDTFKGNGVTDRGIWVGYVKNTYYQPIMYARWNVKTIAGDVN